MISKMLITIASAFALKPSRRESETNEDRRSAVANVAEAAALDTDEDAWFQVAPFGEFLGSKPGRNQNFGSEEASKMVAEFNSLRGRLGRAFRGAPIFIGHPDADRQNFPDERRLGKIVALEERSDGLWAKPEWNSLGKENLTEGFWVYPSPHWDAPVAADFRPDRLISVGLTNTPRIPTSAPMTNAQTPLQEENQPINNETMDPQMIRAKLGLAAEATDEEVMSKLGMLMTAAEDADKAKTAEANEKAAQENAAKQQEANALLDFEKQKAALIKERDQARAAEANAKLDAAIVEGRITQAERPEWEVKLNGANRESEANALAALKPKLNRQLLENGDRRQDRETADNLRESVANAVIKIQKEDGLPYQDAWNKVKKEARFADFFNPKSS